MMTTSKPLITVIIATYNSSHLLKYAIKSVLDSDYDHFELLVIGDCCTDDTEQCVASFGDDRIRFYNLEKNSGQQATPNNWGLKKAKGEYIAFLNQDDLFFPDHLSSCLTLIRQSKHQIICVPYINISPSSETALKEGDFDIKLYGSPPNGRYSPLTIYIASTWFFEKSVINTVGYWKTENMTYEAPSQEWLFRAWKKGVSIGFSKKISVMTLFSGHRKNAYKLKESYEHEFFFKKLNDSQFISNLYETLAVSASAKLIESKHYQPFKNMIRVLLFPIHSIAVRLGINPRAIKSLIRYRGKGKFIKWHRKHTGLGNT